MSLVPYLTFGALGWGIVLLSTPRMLKRCGRLDKWRPPELHHRPHPPVSRLGGLSLAAAYFGVECVILFTGDEDIEYSVDSFLVNNAPLAMFAVGLWDDLKRLRALTKLAWQILIAAGVTFSGVCIQCLEPPWVAGMLSEEGWESVVTIVWLVICTNAINLVDGVDGLATSIGLILMASLVWLSQAGQVCLTAGLIGALLAFLLFNFPPARVYLGDGGAYFIGFQLGLCSTLASQQRCGPEPLTLVLFGLTLPLFDTVLALVRRGLRGLPLFRPDRNHLHHCLLETGMSPRRLVLWYCGVTLICSFAGWLLSKQPQTCFIPISIVGALLLAGSLWQLRLQLGGWATLKRALKSSVAMRREITYALCLRTWLKQEAVRCASVEELYADLKLAARRLGFTSVQLALADGTRAWKQPSVCGPLLATRHALQGGTLGVLELEAPRCRLSLLKTARSSGSKNSCGPSCQPLLNDVRLVRILSELLAESWVEATRDWNPGKARLRYDHELPCTMGIAWRRLPASSGQLRRPERDLKPKRRLAGIATGFLRRAFGVRLCAAVLVADVGMSSELARPALLQESFAEISRAELPAKAAYVVKTSRLSERAEITTAVVRAAGKVNPVVVPAVVGAICKTTPQVAAMAAGKAAQQYPENACLIAKAAAASAPAETRAIVVAVCRAVPQDFRDVALSVQQAVPGSSNEILEALTVLMPELRSAIRNKSAAVSATISASALLDSSKGQIAPKPEFIRSGFRPTSRDPLTSGHTIGPPFVPLSGTVTNINRSTSGTVPAGGRNYARP